MPHLHLDNDVSLPLVTPSLICWWSIVFMGPSEYAVVPPIHRGPLPWLAWRSCQVSSCQGRGALQGFGDIVSPLPDWTGPTVSASLSTAPRVARKPVRPLQL